VSDLWHSFPPAIVSLSSNTRQPPAAAVAAQSAASDESGGGGDIPQDQNQGYNSTPPDTPPARQLTRRLRKTSSSRLKYHPEREVIQDYSEQTPLLAANNMSTTQTYDHSSSSSSSSGSGSSSISQSTSGSSSKPLVNNDSDKDSIQVTYVQPKVGGDSDERRDPLLPHPRSSHMHYDCALPPSHSSRSSSPLTAAEVAASAPVDPHAPAGETGCESGATLDGDEEGTRQLFHENPDSIGEIVERLIASPSSPAATDGARVIAEGEVDKYDHVTGGTFDVAREELDRIARRFQPKIWLYEEEKYRPCSIAHYLSHCNLMYDPVGCGRLEEYLLVKAAPKPSELDEHTLFKLLREVQERTSDPRLEGITFENMMRSRFHCVLNSEEGRYGVPWSEINRVPFYCRLRRYSDHWEIVYILTFAYNGPFRICGREVGAHCADVEHVTVRTNKDATKMEWCFFGSHGVADGVWRHFDEFESVHGDMPYPTRPVVYVADHSHATYPAPGTWYRLCCLANDIVSGGKHRELSHCIWDPIVPPLLLFDSRDPRFDPVRDHEELGFMMYSGTLGEDCVAPPMHQGWWHAESAYSNNCFRRAWWPCRYLTCGNEICYNVAQWRVNFEKKKKNTKNNSEQSRVEDE